MFLEPGSTLRRSRGRPPWPAPPPARPRMPVEPEETLERRRRMSWRSLEIGTTMSCFGRMFFLQIFNSSKLFKTEVKGYVSINGLWLWTRLKLLLILVFTFVRFYARVLVLYSKYNCCSLFVLCRWECCFLFVLVCFLHLGFVSVHKNLSIISTHYFRGNYYVFEPSVHWLDFQEWWVCLWRGFRHAGTRAGALLCGGKVILEAGVISGKLVDKSSMWGRNIYIYIHLDVTQYWQIIFWTKVFLWKNIFTPQQGYNPCGCI